MNIPTAFAKSTICWLAVEDRDWPAWYVPVGDTAYVVAGPGEQELPDLPATLEITLRARAGLEHAGRFNASVTRLSEGDAEWDEALAALRTARLNSPSDDLDARWTAEGAVWAVRPDFESPGVVERDAPSGAREPEATSATTPVPIPRHLGGRRRRDG